MCNTNNMFKVIITSDMCGNDGNISSQQSSAEFTYGFMHLTKSTKNAYSPQKQTKKHFHR